MPKPWQRPLVCPRTRRIQLSPFWLASSLAWSAAIGAYVVLVLAVTP